MLLKLLIIFTDNHLIVSQKCSIEKKWFQLVNKARQSNCIKVNYHQGLLLNIDRFILQLLASSLFMQVAYFKLYF